MTLPTITSGVGWQDDLDDDTDWTETEDGCSAVLTVENGTIFQIAVSAAVGNKKVYYSYPDEAGADNISISSTVYCKVVLRYKTSNNNIKAKVELVFSDGTTEVVMAEQSKTTWKYVKADIATSGKTIDHIRLYATNDEGTVYYDFVSIYQTSFEFPDFSVVDVNPKPKLAVIPIPGSDTDVTQHVGRGNTEITIEAPMRSGDTWGGSHLTYGEYLMQIVGEPYFQWLETDQGNFKVTPAPEGFRFIQREEEGHQVSLVCRFIEYDAGDASIFSAPAWYGINQ